MRWTSPEALETKKFSTASDVWSFAIVMVEIMQDGKRPYPQWKDLDEVAYKVKSGATHELPDGCPDGLFAIMTSCWSFTPAERPSFVELTNTIVELVGPDAAGFNQTAVEVPELHQAMENVYLQSMYQRLTSDSTDGGSDHHTELNLYDALRNTDTVNLAEAAAAAEVHCGCSLQEEVNKALSFAKRLRGSRRGQQYASQMTINDIAVIHLYTQETKLYKMMNGTLGGWGEDCLEAIKHYLPIVRLLVIAMDKLPPISGTVYRGIRLSIEQVLGGLTVGDILTWGAFTSSTLRSDVLRDPLFLGIGSELGERVVFVITILNGVKIMTFSDKGSASEYFFGVAAESDSEYSDNEEEVLLRPGTKFKMDAIIHREGGITEVQMHEVATATTLSSVSHLTDNGRLPTTVRAEESEEGAVNQEYLQPVPMSTDESNAKAWEATEYADVDEFEC